MAKKRGGGITLGKSDEEADRTVIGEKCEGQISFDERNGIFKLMQRANGKIVF